MTTPYDPPSKGDSDQVNKEKDRSTWLPIASGMLIGMVIWLVSVSTPAFNVILHRTYRDMSSKSFTDEYYWILRITVLLMALIGGGIGTHYSTWPKARAITFLLGAIVVVATFAVLGFP